MTQPPTETRFEQALDVINQSLEANRDRMPYKQFIKAGEKMLGDKKVGVAVYSDDPNTPHDYYTLALLNDHLQIVEHGKEDPDLTWKVSEDYINELVGNPQKYIDHPEKMDWDWIRDRMGR